MIKEKELLQIQLKEEHKSNIELKGSVPVKVNLSADDVLKVEVMQGIINKPETGEIYKGNYKVTPNQSKQILNTSGKTLTDNIVVEPIPSNYGKIIWNGSAITIV